jgi:hypothetical protein
MGLWGQIQHDAGAVILIAIAAIIVYLLRRMNVMPFSPTEKAAVERADRAENELAEANKRIGELEQTRSMRPIVEALARNSELQSQILERLANYNGSFKHMEDSLAAVRGSLSEVLGSLGDHANGMRALTGTIAELHGIELRPEPRHTNT